MCVSEVDDDAKREEVIVVYLYSIYWLLNSTSLAIFQNSTPSESQNAS